MRFLVALVVLTVAAVSLLAREPSQQDYEVWASVIPGDIPPLSPDPVYIWHLAEPPSVFARGMEEMTLQKHSEFGPAAKMWRDEPAEIDIEKLNAAINTNGGKFRFHQPVKLLDQRTLEKIVGRTPKSSWIASPRLTSGVQAIYRLSWPAYREDGRSALVMTGSFSILQGAIWEFVVGKNQRGHWWPTSNAYRTLAWWGSTAYPEIDGRLFIE